MRHTFLVLVVALATIATSISAQTKEGAKPKVNKADQKEQMSARFAKELGLSESQAAKFTEINETYIEDRKEAAKSMKSAQEKAEQTKMKSIVKLLNDEQMAKLLAMKDRQAQQKAKQGPMQRRPMQGKDQMMKRRPMQQRGQMMQRRPMQGNGQMAPQHGGRNTKVQELASEESKVE